MERQDPRQGLRRSKEMPQTTVLKRRIISKLEGTGGGKGMKERGKRIENTGIKKNHISRLSRSAERRVR